MRDMPSPAPKLAPNTKNRLRKLGEQIHAHRKGLGISAVATAESAGISRVTLHRIEKGEASVTVGAYMSVLLALGLLWSFQSEKNTSKLPLHAKIPINKYPQLKRLAWQIKDDQVITPKEALELYERNWRHVDLVAMEAEEQELIHQLLATFGRERLLV